MAPSFIVLGHLSLIACYAQRIWSVEPSCAYTAEQDVSVCTCKVVHQYGFQRFHLHLLLRLVVHIEDPAPETTASADFVSNRRLLFRMEAYDGTCNFQAKVCYIKQLLDDRVFLAYIVRCVAAGVLAAHLEASTLQAQDTHDADRLNYSFVLQSMH